MGNILSYNLIGGTLNSSNDNLLSNKSLTKITYSELKNLRDTGKLIPGKLYRITDYQCTTTQENTKSAGHQFDIVLLALSNNKLAEEGWAMMHDGVDMFNDYDIYTVTFNDGVSKEYYLKIIEIPDESDPDNPYLNTRIVDVKTFRGNEIPNSRMEQYGFIIDDENKTATNAYVSSTQFESYLQTQYSYNYFQNSNLSAWKVWYCLDNDTTRFAWADDSLDEDSPASYNDGSFDYVRASDEDINIDGVDYYGWINEDEQVHYTTSQEPSVGDTTYSYKGEMLEAVSIISFTPAHEGIGLPNGRGVIYRLIDEWGNNVGWDFKNILFESDNYYTFSSDTADDLSVVTSDVRNNLILLDTPSTICLSSNSYIEGITITGNILCIRNSSLDTTVGKFTYYGWASGIDKNDGVTKVFTRTATPDTQTAVYSRTDGTLSASSILSYNDHIIVMDNSFYNNIILTNPKSIISTPTVSTVIADTVSSNKPI